jgi:hypothetical protein
MVTLTASVSDISDDKDYTALVTPHPTKQHRPHLGSNDSSNENLFAGNGEFVEEKGYFEGKRVRNDVMAVNTNHQQQPPTKKFAAVRRSKSWTRTAVCLPSYRYLVAHVHHLAASY